MLEYWEILAIAGKRPLADVWALDTAAKPYEWRKLEPEGDGPPPCMYVYHMETFIVIILLVTYICEGKSILIHIQSGWIEVSYFYRFRFPRVVSEDYRHSVYVASDAP